MPDSSVGQVVCASLSMICAVTTADHYLDRSRGTFARLYHVSSCSCACSVAGNDSVDSLSMITSSSLRRCASLATWLFNSICMCLMVACYIVSSNETQVESRTRKHRRSIPGTIYRHHENDRAWFSSLCLLALVHQIRPRPLLQEACRSRIEDASRLQLRLGWSGCNIHHNLLRYLVSMLPL
jgi:hypothetical protein